MTDCIKNNQYKNHFVHDQKHAKKIKRSIENNLSRNGCTVLSNGIFQMLHIPISKNIKRPTAEAVVRRCSVKKVLLEILQNLQEGTCKIDLKINLNLKNRLQHSGVFL